MSIASSDAQQTIRMSFGRKTIKTPAPIRYVELLQGVDRLLADFRNSSEVDGRNVVAQLYAGRNQYEITKQSDWDEFVSRSTQETVLRIQVHASLELERGRFVRDEDEDSFNCASSECGSAAAAVAPPPPVQEEDKPFDAVRTLRALNNALLADEALAREVSDVVCKLLTEHAPLAQKLLASMKQQDPQL